MSPLKYRSKREEEGPDLDVSVSLNARRALRPLAEPGGGSLSGEAPDQPVRGSTDQTVREPSGDRRDIG